MKKFGKKLLKTVLAGTMLIAMGMTTLAAPSAEVDGIVTDIVESVDKNGTDVDVTVIPVSAENKEVADAIKDEAALKDTLGDSFKEGMKVLDVREVMVNGDADLVEWPITVTFKVPGVVTSSQVTVLCYVDGEWTVVTAKAGNGTVTATLDCEGPVAFVVSEGTLAPSSPTTGEGMMTTAVLCAVAVAAAGAVVLKKRTIA